jgi:hypothetical protein
MAGRGNPWSGIGPLTIDYGFGKILGEGYFSVLGHFHFYWILKGVRSWRQQKMSKW